MQLAGTLDEVRLLDLLRLLAAAKQTGVLLVRTQPPRRITVVDGGVELVDRSDGVLSDRAAAWQRDGDGLELFRLRKERLMELVVIDRSAAGFEFVAQSVASIGLPPLDLDELDRRSLVVADPVAPDATRWRQDAVDAALSGDRLGAPRVALTAQETRSARTAANRVPSARQRALSRLIQAIRST